MIMERGDYTLLHDHAPADWSSVWYVDVGQEGSGQIDMVHPGRPPGGVLVDMFPSLASFTPVSGMLLVFPGFLQHYVHPYTGETPRISVSMNARVMPEP